MVIGGNGWGECPSQYQRIHSKSIRRDMGGVWRSRRNSGPSEEDLGSKDLMKSFKDTDFSNMKLSYNSPLIGISKFFGSSTLLRYFNIDKNWTAYPKKATKIESK